MLFQNLIEKVDILSEFYVISFKSGVIHSKLTSENFKNISTDLKVQFIEKILSNNFKKIYIRMYFKNEKDTNRLVNNMIIFEISLIKKNGRLNIKSINSLLYLENDKFAKYLKQFFNDNECECNIYTIETDIKKINKLNNRTYIKIKSDIKLLNNLHEFFTFNNMTNINVINNCYKDKIKFELELEYTFLENIIKNKKIMIGFDNYTKVMANIQNEIRNYDLSIRKKYKSNLFKSLKNNEFVFFLTEFEIKNNKDILKILKEFEKLLNIKTNEEKLEICKKLVLLKQPLFKQNYFDLIEKIDNLNLLLKHQITNMDVSIIRISAYDRAISDLRQKFRHIENSQHTTTSYGCYYLKFKISKLYIYVNLTLVDISKFEKIQNHEIIFSLLKKILSNTIITDELEKDFFEQN